MPVATWPHDWAGEAALEAGGREDAQPRGVGRGAAGPITRKPVLVPADR